MVNEAFQWKCQPNAESLVLRHGERCVQGNSFIEHLSEDLAKHTSTRLFDWIDHVVVGHSEELIKELEEYGFVDQHATATYRLFYHPGAQLPRVVVSDKEEDCGLAMAVESIADFLMVRGLTASIDGSPYSLFRRACVSIENGVTFWVVERRGTELVEPNYMDLTGSYFEAIELWQTRPRELVDEEGAIQRALQIADELVLNLGVDLAAHLVLEVERKYWQARNGAGQIQKSRQDRLGLGWANHDHHTFRSSRKHFQLLVRLFEILGFHCRERFYAGEEAGWGAQVMENPRAKLVLFLDVDLASHELEIDFAHEPLPELKDLGTIGLWCALHGDSILKAGMHHLEAQFQFEELIKDLASVKVRVMEPFSNFPYLKQAFTEGEVWHVDPSRLEKLIKAKKITKEQGEKFLSYGAVGSHLENLQRREGYKGFNQKNVSFIIKKTDPRLFT